MEREKNSVHIFYIIVPLAAYMGVNFAAVVLGGWFHWTNGTLNVIAQLVNLVILYVGFYRPYRQRGADSRMPPLFLAGSAAADRVNMPAASYILAVILGFFCSLAMNGWINILRLDEVITTYEEVAESIYSGSLPFIIFRTVVLASFVEELLMRGLCYHAVSQILGRAAGMLLSALIFGVIHGNLLQGLYAFVLGILFAYIYDMYDRKIAAPILAHMAANIFSVAGSTMPGLSRWVAQNYTILTVVSTVLLAAAAAGLYMCRRYARNSVRDKCS